MLAQFVCILTTLNLMFYILCRLAESAAINLVRSAGCWWLLMQKCLYWWLSWNTIVSVQTWNAKICFSHSTPWKITNKLLNLTKFLFAFFFSSFSLSRLCSGDEWLAITCLVCYGEWSRCLLVLCIIHGSNGKKRLF